MSGRQSHAVTCAVRLALKTDDSICDIAQQCGVSPSSIYRALDRREADPAEIKREATLERMAAEYLGSAKFAYEWVVDDIPPIVAAQRILEILQERDTKGMPWFRKVTARRIKNIKRLLAGAAFRQSLTRLHRPLPANPAA